MAYHPNAQHALCAYMTVAAHLGDVPLSAIDTLGLANVTPTEWNEFIISYGSGGDPFDSLIAVCTYIKDDAIWGVQLPTGEALGVADTGSGFVVVEG
jgi:hypothetical protein